MTARTLLIQAIAAGAAFASGAHVGASDDLQEALDWVEALPGGAVYTDAYQIASPPSLDTETGQQRMIPVALIDYYRRAWDTFLDQDELDPIQREPRHYKIGHELAGSKLTVVIQGLLLPRVHDGRPEGIMRMSVGPSMRLRYSLETGELLDKHLLK